MLATSIELLADCWTYEPLRAIANSLGLGLHQGAFKRRAAAYVLLTLTTTGPCELGLQCRASRRVVRRVCPPPDSLVHGPAADEGERRHLVRWARLLDGLWAEPAGNEQPVSAMSALQRAAQRGNA